MVLRDGRALRGDCLRERSPAREPSRRSARAPALGLPATRVRRRAGAPVSQRLRDPGSHRPAGHVAEPCPVPAQLPGAGRRSLRIPWRAAHDRGLGRLLDVARREPVPRLPWDRQLPHLSLRRGRPLGRCELSHARARGAPRHRGQVERRLRGDGDAHAPPRSLRRAGHARGRCPLRDVLPARLQGGRASAPRRLRRLVRAVLGGLPLAARPLEGKRRVAPEQLVHGGVRPIRTAPSDSRSTRTRASSTRRSGSGGSRGTRSAWPPSGPMRSAR